MRDNKTYTLNQTASERIETEALAWVAQLSGDEFTEKDLAAFREWILRSPAHEEEIKTIVQLWGEMNSLTELQEPIAQADRLAKSLRRQDSRRKKMGYRITTAAACLCIMAGLTWTVLTPAKPLPVDTPVQTAAVSVPVVAKSAIGEQQVHTLPDGSVITLNTDSHIDIDYTEQQRTVRLIKGEALFTVAKDESKPFVVVADHGVIRAVGTEFSVRLLNKGVDVVVSEGAVELASLNQTLPTQTDVLNLNDVSQMSSLGVITAGQTAIIANSEASVQLHDLKEIDSKLAWKSGRLEFLGKPLKEVVAEVGRYTDLQITINDPEIESLSFGGAFMIGDTDLLFRTLDSQYGITAVFSEGEKSVHLVNNRQ